MAMTRLETAEAPAPSSAPAGQHSPPPGPGSPADPERGGGCRCAEQGPPPTEFGQPRRWGRGRGGRGPGKGLGRGQGLGLGLGSDPDGSPGRSVDGGKSDCLLSQASPGGSVEISGILGGRRVARDLGDLGVRVGARVSIERRLAGGAVTLRRGGMTVAIGAGLARQVMVRPLAD